MNFRKFINSGYSDPTDPLNVAWLALAEKYALSFGEPEIGNTRMTFLEDGWVYKVPRNFQGIDDNQKEADWNDPFIPLAKCSIITEMPSGIPVLKMERVEPFVSATLPEWTDWVDCAQVGYTKSGDLVAYDL